MAICIFYCMASLEPLHSFNLLRHPEIAEPHTLFLDIAFAEISYPDGFEIGPPIEIRVDYLLPVPLPVSIGGFFKTPHPNFKSFGPRLAYHIDIDHPRTDVYVLYQFDFGFVRNELLEAHGDEPQPFFLYDFRVGLRWSLNTYFLLSLETSFKLRGLRFALSIKPF